MDPSLEVIDDDDIKRRLLQVGAFDDGLQPLKYVGQ
jgi:hypothetical protein